MINPADLDPSGAWLLDKIAAKRCHYYFCESGGTHQVEATYLFRLDGATRPVTQLVWECDGHGNRRARAETARPSPRSTVAQLISGKTLSHSRQRR